MFFKHHLCRSFACVVVGALVQAVRRLVVWIVVDRRTYQGVARRWPEKLPAVTDTPLQCLLIGRVSMIDRESDSE